jgi:hypothetical protein
MGSVGHVVHSGASGPSNGKAKIFMLGSSRCGFHKKCVKIGSSFRTCVFVSDGICRSHSAEFLFLFAPGGICGSCSAF